MKKDQIIVVDNSMVQQVEINKKTSKFLTDIFSLNVSYYNLPLSSVRMYFSVPVNVVVLPLTYFIYLTLLGLNLLPLPIYLVCYERVSKLRSPRILALIGI